MKKLRLNLDALAVEAFEPQAPAHGEGTVHAHDDSTGRSYYTWERCCTAETFVSTCAALDARNA